MRRTTATLLGVIAFCSLGACHPHGSQAPFYLYNASLLNGGVAWSEAGTGLQGDRARDDRDLRESQQPAGFNKPANTQLQVTQKAAGSSIKTSKKPLQFQPERAAEYVLTVYKINGVDLGITINDEAISEVYATVKEQGTVYHATRPAVGDLAFFHNTYDRNSDARNNDWYTHIGIVEMVEKDGTIHVLCYMNGGVQSFVMNLEHPKLEKDERSSKVWNTELRVKGTGDPPFTQHMSGELFAGFGNILGDRTEFVVIDNWAPGMTVPKR